MKNYITDERTGLKYELVGDYYIIAGDDEPDEEQMFSVDDASVNGFMADPFYATSVSAGKCAFSSMAWSDTTLEENGITEVEEIEVLFRAYDADDFMGEDFANEVITLNP